jgi:hypothetical protein
MSDERTPKVPTEEGRAQDPWGAGEPALTPRGTPQRPPVEARGGAEIHAFPETAVGEGDVRTAGEATPAKGTSLWRDAWKRLLKNRLAVFGMFVVGIIAVAVVVGPPIIKAATGFTYDFIPPGQTLSYPPFTAPDGSFSWTHPMGTDSSGRDVLARVLQGGRTSCWRACSRAGASR